MTRDESKFRLQRVAESSPFVSCSQELMSEKDISTVDCRFFQRFDSFKMKCSAAPFLGSDIGDGFGEVPAMAAKVLSVVLALSIGLILRLSQDDGTVPSRTLAVTLSIFDPNLNDVRIVGYYIAFGDREAAVAGFHLNAVIGDAKTDREAERV
jgi:hypothetical protein